MEAFDEKIAQVLKENSEWPGSADELWGKVATRLQPERKKRLWPRKPLWFGAAAATVLLAIMLHNLSTPLPPAEPELTEMPQLRSFSVSMLAEPLVYRPGEQVEVALHTYPEAESLRSPGLRLVIWKEVEGEQVVVSETILEDDDILVQPSLMVRTPTEPGIYRFVVEGLWEGEEFTTVFGDVTIRVE